MSVNKTYTEFQDKLVATLVENGNYDKATNHVTFDAKKVDLPKGVTSETIQTHVGFFNDLSAATEVATGQIARDQRETNDQLTTVDGSLNMFDAFSINSQHHLQQQIGEEYVYGQSLTSIDYTHSEEQADWLVTQRAAADDLAAKLFG